MSTVRESKVQALSSRVSKIIGIFFFVNLGFRLVQSMEVSFVFCGHLKMGFLLLLLLLAHNFVSVEPLNFFFVSLQIRTLRSFCLFCLGFSQIGSFGYHQKPLPWIKRASCPSKVKGIGIHHSWACIIVVVPFPNCSIIN